MKLNWLTAWWAIFIAGCILRFVHLNTPGLWYDEAGSTWMASLPVTELVAATAGDVHPPLSMLVIKPMIWLFGIQPWAVRLPSVLFGILSLWLTRKVGERIGLPMSAIVIASAFVAFSPEQLYFSQEARMYALLEFCVLAMTLTALNRHWLAFMLVAACALYSHNYGVIYLVVLGVAVFIREALAPMGESHLDYMPLFFLVPVFLFAPWVLVVMGQMRDYAADWIAPVTFTGFIQPLVEFVWPSFAIDFGPWLGATLLGLMLIAFGVSRVITQPTTRSLFLAWMVFAPMLIAAVISFAWKPMYLFRALIGCAPFFFLLIGWALADTPRKAKWAALAFAPLFVVSVLSYYPNVVRAKDTIIPPREIADYVTENWRTGDVIYHGNVGTVMPLWPFMQPNMSIYLMPVQGDSLGMLRPATRQAMGMDEVWLADVEWRRAWLIWSAGPTIAADEDLAVTALLNAYPHRQVRYYENDYSTFGMWLLYNPRYAVGMTP